MSISLSPRSARRTSLLVVGVWVIAALAAVVLAGDLSDAYAEEDLAFLPSGTASAALLEEEQRAHRGLPETQTATIVAASSTPFSEEDREALADLSRTVSAAPHLSAVVAEGPIISDDRRVAVLEVELSADDDETVEAVARLRDVCDRWASDSGLDAFVTGEAGVDADLEAGNVDLWLLLSSVVVVAVILAAVYRSLILWLLPVGTGLVAVLVSRGMLVILAEASVTITELTASIGTVVVFGICTDYALLLLNRLRNSPCDDRREALAHARREIRTPILVSAGTIVLSVLALTLSTVPGISGLGPALAVGVISAAAVSLTLLPALLLLLGVPVKSAKTDGRQWRRLARVVLAHRGASLLGAVMVIAAMGSMAFMWESSADPLAGVPDGAPSKRGALLVREHLSEGSTSPLIVSFSPRAPRDNVEELTARAAQEGLTLRVLDSEQVDDRLEVSLALGEAGFTSAWAGEADAVLEIARDIDERSLVGGSAAEAVDRELAVESQLLRLSPPLALALLAAVALWLRSIRVAMVVVASSLLTCVAAVGATAATMSGITGSGQSSAEVLLFGLLFLIAFGIDYQVFLVDGVRRAAPGPYAKRVEQGLAATGPVITSAGLVLAATFSMLLFVPEASVRQVGLLVACGVLIDTFVVRTLLVPPMLSWAGSRWAREAPSTVRLDPNPGEYRLDGTVG